MSMGKGRVVSKSTKQKITTTSSLAAKLVGTFETMIDVIWKNYFLKSNILGDVERCLLYFNLPFDDIIAQDEKP